MSTMRIPACRFQRVAIALLWLVGVALCLPVAADWEPVEVPIMTRWGKTVTPENAWREYPRPQMKRAKWLNLNGLWDYAVTGIDAAYLGALDGKILVPYCIEAPLSGVGRNVSPDEAIWYTRSFNVPGSWKGQDVLLNFEAVDWEAKVWVNGTEVGFHRGGYAPFSFDITGALKESGTQELTVRVWDPGPSNFQALGKQNNRTDYYEASSGIWQTVWLEPVAETHITSLKVTSHAIQGQAVIEVEHSGTDSALEIRVEVPGATESRVTASQAILEFADPRPWSPRDPHLYPLTVKLMRNSEIVDTVESYFGLRTIERKRIGQYAQILLNGEPIFQHGPLDQNYWPESVLTPPSDTAARWEVAYLKDIGCNMVRMHMKQNLRRWYYHCDQLGLLVWQDFVSPQKPWEISTQESRQWVEEQRRMMDTLHNHPSIVMWIVFNEMRGQHDSERITHWAMDYDPSRLVSVASGWTDVPGVGDIRDIHDYTIHTSVPVAGSEPDRAIVLGEYGGFNSVVVDHNWYDMGKPNSEREITPIKGKKGHMWPSEPLDEDWTQDFKRPTYTPGGPLEEHLSAAVDDLSLLTAHGLCGAVYTQLTDMKHEQNGWLSFDREVSKVPKDALRRMHLRLHEPPPTVRPIAMSEPWRYTTTLAPGDAWTLPEYDDRTWDVGDGPFGDEPNYRIGTPWKAPSLLLRKKFNLDAIPDNAALAIYFAGQSGGETDICRVYLNGSLITDSQARHKRSEHRVTAMRLRPEAIALLLQGENVLAAEVTLPKVSPRLFDLILQEIVATE